jgi:hypothetical protein
MPHTAYTQRSGVLATVRPKHSLHDLREKRFRRKEKEGRERERERT